MFNTYTIKFNNTPTQPNFANIAGEVIWDTVFEHTPKAAYTQTFTADSVTLDFKRGQLTAEAAIVLWHQLQDLAVEFA